MITHMCVIILLFWNIHRKAIFILTDSKQSSRTKSYASVAGTTGGPDTSASQVG